MTDKMLDKLLKWKEKRIKKKIGGIPLVNVIYKPEQEIPNIFYNMHPSIKQDEYLNTQFKEIADYLREKYTDEWDYLK